TPDVAGRPAHARVVPRAPMPVPFRLERRMLCLRMVFATHRLPSRARQPSGCTIIPASAQRTGGDTMPMTRIDPHAGTKGNARACQEREEQRSPEDLATAGWCSTGKPSPAGLLALGRTVRSNRLMGEILAKRAHAAEEAPRLGGELGRVEGT